MPFERRLSYNRLDPLNPNWNLHEPRRDEANGWDEFKALAMNKVTSLGEGMASNKLGEYDLRAQIEVSSSEEGVNFHSIDLFKPLYEDPEHLVFTQTGYRRSNMYTADYRNTLNLGLGYRRIFDNQYLVGSNIFYDKDLTEGNERLGLGLEYMADYLSLSANSYIRLSNWKETPDLEEYLERPANGFDLRATGYLPSHPQLGASLVYEKYYGDEVGLFGFSSRQKNPSVTTASLSYTPVPLVTFSTNYRRGQNGLSDTSYNLTFNYQFGVPLRDQLAPASVGLSRQLGEARNSFVDRNNEIVMEYKKQPSPTITLPARLSGAPLASISFPMKLGKGLITNYSWAGSASAFAKPYSGEAMATIVLPSFDASGLNTYTLQAKALDRFGREISSNILTIEVVSATMSLERSKAIARADGSDEVQFTATLADSLGEPLADRDVAWTVTGQAQVTEQDDKTNTQGTARLKMVSFRAMSVQVVVTESEGAESASSVTFAGDVDSASVQQLSASPTSLVANGTSHSTLTAKVLDAEGLEVGEGVEVTWTTTLGSLESGTSRTDVNSQARMKLTAPTTAGAASVQASAIGGFLNTTVTFTPDTSTSQIADVTPAHVALPADGLSTTLITARVVDGNASPLGAGHTVTWSTTAGTLSVASSVTDEFGLARVTLMAPTLVSQATITASTPTSNDSTVVEFEADTSTLRLDALTASANTLIADGVSQTTLSTRVIDANNNPVNGATVNWSATSGVLQDTASVTNALGVASTTLTASTLAGISTVSASAASAVMTIPVDFIANDTTATVSTISVSNDPIIANGSDTSTITAYIVDANNNLVGAGVPVNWTTTAGTLSSASTVTNFMGQAQVVLTAGVSVATATVQASTANGSRQGNVSFLADSNAATVIGINGSSASITANGSSTSVVMAMVSDINGNPIQGYSVVWTHSGDGTLSAASSLTDSSGVAQVTYTSGLIAQSVSIQAKAGASTMSFNIEQAPDSDNARIESLVSNLNTLVATGSTTTQLSAIIRDANGNLIPGAVVNWSATSGSLASASSIADANGVVTNILTSSTVAGTATITASVTGDTKTLSVTYIADLSTAAIQSLNALEWSSYSNGVDRKTVWVTVQDANGNPIENAPVTWETTIGTYTGDTQYTTDANGVAYGYITSLNSGEAVIKAGYLGDFRYVGLNFRGDNRQSQIASLQPSSISAPADGVTEVTVTINVHDDNNNPVYAQPVLITASGGTMSVFASTTDWDGTVVTTIRSALPGDITITATTNGTTGSAVVSFTH